MYYFCPEKLTTSWTEPSTSVFKTTPTFKKKLDWAFQLEIIHLPLLLLWRQTSLLPTPTSFWTKLLAAHTQPFSIHYRNTLCYSFLYALCHWCNGKTAKDCVHTGCAEAHLSLSLLYLQMDIMMKKWPTEGFMHHSEQKKSVSKVSRYISAAGQSSKHATSKRWEFLMCERNRDLSPLT